MPQSSLTGKHALVTGASRGIGLAIARTLAAEGASVTLVGRDAQRLQDALVKLGGVPGNSGIAVADVTVAADIERAFDEAARARGAIAILVNNAGAAQSAPFGKTSEALWASMLNANLTSAYLCTQHALPAMLAARWGRVVNIASTAGLKGYPYVSAYCAAKHGLIGLTRALALETAKNGVTVNAVCPGFTETDMVEQTIDNIVAKTGRTRDAAREELARHNPLGRLIQPEEVANAVVWLCRDESAAMTGQCIAVDGGET